MVTILCLWSFIDSLLSMLSTCDPDEVTNADVFSVLRSDWFIYRTRCSRINRPVRELKYKVFGPVIDQKLYLGQ